MAKERENNNHKNLFIGLLGNYAAKLKLLLTTLVLLCCVSTLLHFIPPPSSSSQYFTIFSASDVRFCISKLSSQTSQQPSPPPLPPPPPPSTLVVHEQALSNGTIKRFFNPFGSAAYSFITMGAYRGGLNTFAIVGLSSKPLHVYGNPTYECEWVPNSMNNKNVNSSSSKPITTVGYKILPDWGYGHVYTVVVVNCTFNNNHNNTSSSSSSKNSSNLVINGDNNGGKLALYASTSGGGDAKFNYTERIEVLEEAPGEVDFSVFAMSPRPYYKYDYFYCGSSLYGELNPQRVREWIAYHVKLFGPRSHFVMHDAGGVHEKVMEVLRPWIELGYVTLHDIRDQERFDGYYHNQFMVVNDCLHRYKFVAKWMFFFDVDEYIYVPPKSTIKTVLDSLSEYSQFTIEQMPMSSKICLSEDYGKTYRKWGFEKLVYRDSITGIRRDRKYAVQPRSLYATGVHMSQDLAGKTTHKTEGKIMYFHYHGTIAEKRESCKVLVNSTQVTYDKVPYVLDTTLRNIAGVIKKFEQRMIGSWLHNNTRL